MTIPDGFPVDQKFYPAGRTWTGFLTDEITHFNCSKVKLLVSHPLAILIKSKSGLYIGKILTEL